MRKKRARVLVGPDAKAMDVLVRLTGAGYQRLFATVTRRLMPRPK
ncbi:short-chain dehydrogenase [Mycobacterium tuberculosis]|nr:short-chain dehydrogenase [Mycobacterium tuberculosis]